MQTGTSLPQCLAQRYGQHLSRLDLVLIPLQRVGIFAGNTSMSLRLIPIEPVDGSFRQCCPWTGLLRPGSQFSFLDGLFKYDEPRVVDRAKTAGLLGRWSWTRTVWQGEKRNVPDAMETASLEECTTSSPSAAWCFGAEVVTSMARSCIFFRETAVLIHAKVPY